MGTSDRQVAYLQAMIFGRRARHRTLLDKLKRRLWSVSESGVFGWLGDRADSAEHLSHKVAARRYARRRGLPW